MFSLVPSEGSSLSDHITNIMLPDLLSGFLSLLEISILSLCKTGLTKEGSTFYLMKSLLDPPVWIAHLDNVNDLAHNNPRNSKELVLCSIEDFPSNFTFDSLPPEITFLFKMDTLDSVTSAIKTLRLDSSVFVYKEEQESIFEITEVFGIKKGPLIFQHFATWTPGNDFRDANPNKWERRKDLRGANLVDVWNPWPPFLFYDEEKGIMDGKIGH